jgi:hypothetical protein
MTKSFKETLTPFGRKYEESDQFLYVVAYLFYSTFSFQLFTAQLENRLLTFCNFSVVAKVEKDVTEGVKDAVTIPSKDSDAEEIKKAVIKNVLWQMDHDRKTTSLKQLQGHIWREAYNSGELIGE